LSVDVTNSASFGGKLFSFVFVRAANGDGFENGWTDGKMNSKTIAMKRNVPAMFGAVMFGSKDWKLLL
jgi:hypothetical protein